MEDAMLAAYPEDISSAEAICFAEFRSARPEIAQFPHVIYCHDSRIPMRVASDLACRLGIWPYSPRYSRAGELDPMLPADECLCWQEWTNTYNQQYLFQLAGENSGVFATTHGLIVDAGTGGALASILPPDLDFRNEVWGKVPEIVDLCGWAILPSDEGDRFTLVSGPQHGQLVLNIRKYARSVGVETARIRIIARGVAIEGFLAELVPTPQFASDAARQIRQSRNDYEHRRQAKHNSTDERR